MARAERGKAEKFLLLTWLPALMAWFWVWKHLAIEWSANPQYQYGFGVPVLALILAWPALIDRRTGRGDVWFWLLVALAYLCSFGGELLRRHDPLWRVTAGVLALGATLLTAATAYRLGGFFLLRRLAVPVAFLWLALPWPRPIENHLVQYLLGAVTAVTTGLVNLLGVPALRHGNAIELANGVVGLDAACSGIQSFLASVVTSLFLGAFLQLAILRRILLVILGCLLAIAINLFRVLALTLCAAWGGQKFERTVHNPVGLIATLSIFGLIYLAARGLQLPEKKGKTVRVPELLQQPRRSESGWSDRVPAEAFALLLLFGTIPLSVSAFFPRPSSTVLEQRWQLAQPPESSWRITEIRPTDDQRAMLQFSAFKGLAVDLPEGVSARIIHLVWGCDRKMPPMAFYHTPGLCMPSLGWEPVGDPVPWSIMLDGHRLEFNRYIFSDGETWQTVYQHLARGADESAFNVGMEQSRWARLASLWRAPTGQINEELLVYLSGPRDENENVLSRLLTPLLRRYETQGR